MASAPFDRSIVPAQPVDPSFPVQNGCMPFTIEGSTTRFSSAPCPRHLESVRRPIHTPIENPELQRVIDREVAQAKEVRDARDAIRPGLITATVLVWIPASIATTALFVARRSDPGFGHDPASDTAIIASYLIMTAVPPAVPSWVIGEPRATWFTFASLLSIGIGQILSASGDKAVPDAFFNTTIPIAIGIYALALTPHPDDIAAAKPHRLSFPWRLALYPTPLMAHDRAHGGTLSLMAEF